MPEPLILDTVEELGLTDTFQSEDQQVAALRAIARRLRAGRIAPRELAKRAHEHVGHDGSDEAQPFVTFDDMYGDADYGIFDAREVDRLLCEDADALLEGRASPGHTLAFPMLPPLTRDT